MPKTSKQSHCLVKYAGRRFSTMMESEVHIQRNFGENCESCGSSFTTNSRVKVDMKGLKREKQHICEICSSSFSGQSDLEKHIRIHSGEKPYSCEICKSFLSPRKTILGNHRRRHTGEKPYSCKICDSSFAQQSDLEKAYKNIHWREAIFL